MDEDSAFEGPSLVSVSSFFIIEASADDSRNKTAKCTLCKTKNVVLQMSNAGTTNINRHLMRFHSNEYQKTIQHTKREVKKEQKIDDIFCNMKTTKKVTLQDLIAKTISQKFLPFNFFEDGCINSLLTFFNVNASLPGRNDVRKIVLEKYLVGMDIVTKVLQENSSRISFTIDGWTSFSNKSYYGITAHYIDKEFDCHSLCLDMIPALGKHTGEEISKIFTNVMIKFGLVDKVFGITTDNASVNFKFADSVERTNLLNNFSKSESHFVCFAHIINLAVQSFLKEMKLVVFSEEIGDINLNTGDSDQEEYEYEPEEQLSNNSSHFTIDKIKSLAIKIKYSEKLQEKLRECCSLTTTDYQVPKINVCTRWNSMLHMLKWYAKLEKPLRILCSQDQQLCNLEISNDENKLISAVIELLEPFSDVSVLLSGQKYITISTVIVSINLLLDDIEKKSFEFDTKDDRTLIDEALINGLNAARNKILKHYIKTNWVYCIALILDPRHRTKSFNKSSWGKLLKKDATREFEKFFKDNYLKEEMHHENNGKSKITNNNITISDKINSIFQNESNEQLTSHKEINEYLKFGGSKFRNTETVLSWWKENQFLFPCLSLMARDVFSVQATSVPAERLFSRAGLTITKNRNSLNAESIQALMCLNSWYKENII